VHAHQIQRNLLQRATTATTFTGVSIGSSNYQTLRLTEKSIHFRMMQPNFLAANPFIFIWKERLSNGTGGSCVPRPLLNGSNFCKNTFKLISKCITPPKLNNYIYLISSVTRSVIKPIKW
jgi:hypothetical protein